MSSSQTINASAGRVFAYVDDIHNLARHMSESRSMPMMGSKLALTVLTANHTGLGATYRYTGRIVGLAIDFSETVVRYVPGGEKVWRTIGQPQLLIIESYEMSVLVEPVTEATAHLTISIDYELPRSGIRRLLGLILAKPYARWCLDSMTSGTARDLANT